MFKKSIFAIIVLLGLMALISGCNLYESLATVDKVEIIILESFPVQVNVSVNGNLPNPCTTISRVTKYRLDQTFYIRIFTKAIEGACIQMLVPFQKNIPLEVEGLSEGTYYVNVNGKSLGSFTLETDNWMP